MLPRGPGREGGGEDGRGKGGAGVVKDGFYSTAGYKLHPHTYVICTYKMYCRSKFIDYQFSQQRI
jgi:hypothetical protein